ncbi:hypothetical protein [Paenibacillus sp. LHD-38]|uniref:hypothetical protein n=1 Tax=Paenibacillus sp. LHD-38 TaxID=3072143 RepID=UPI00281053CB|nr:hypothetical protein [Paenibacillus sp. LHD-38]MDQ8736141.1 hypothetical protein [Paenibacillus sp. LHD-38]
MNIVIGIIPIILYPGQCRRLATENVSCDFTAIISTGCTAGMIQWGMTEDGLQDGPRCLKAFVVPLATISGLNKGCSSIRSRLHRRISWEALSRPICMAAFMRWGHAFTISRS